MPQSNKQEYNKYMREYMLRRYHARRLKAIKQLGGVCIDCGTETNLEFDHIINEDKKLIGKMFTSASEAKLQLELAKCVLRCKACHRLKTILERGHFPATDTHGTLSSYRYCKCALCCKAKSDYMKMYVK